MEIERGEKEIKTGERRKEDTVARGRGDRERERRRLRERREWDREMRNGD